MNWLDDFNKWLTHEIQMVNKAIHEEQLDNSNCRYLEGISKGLEMAKLEAGKDGTREMKEDWHLIKVALNERIGFLKRRRHVYSGTCPITSTNSDEELFTLLEGVRDRMSFNQIAERGER